MEKQTYKALQSPTAQMPAIAEFRFLSCLAEMSGYYLFWTEAEWQSEDGFGQSEDMYYLFCTRFT